MLLTETLDRLAAFEPVPFPVLSLYLDLRPDETGRDRYDVFLRGALRSVLSTYRAHTPEHESLVRDTERIREYLEREVQPSATGLAIFACAGADDFFEPVPLDVPLLEHRVYIDDQPHLYPLARIDDQFPRYAAVLADTKQARIFVFATGQNVREERVRSETVRRVKVGGWSQARYQRRAQNAAAGHVRELVSALERIVREDDIRHIVLAGDEVVLPLVRDELPPALAERLVDAVSLDIRAPERQVLDETLAVLRARDEESDREAVDALVGAARGNGLGVLGATDVLAALERGQVDQVLISGRPEILTNVDALIPDAAATPPTPAGDVSSGLAAVERAVEARSDAPERLVGPEEKVADRIVTAAKQTGASVRFIEDPELLAEIGGVGATLRYRD